MASLCYKVPAVVIHCISCGIVHKDLIQCLKRKETFISIRCCVIGLCPLLGNIGFQNTGLYHFRFNLVAVLNQRHGKGAAALQRGRRQLIENLIILGLLPLILHRIRRIDGLKVLNK